MAAFAKLEYLDLSRNDLSEIPAELGLLVNLKSLSLSYNDLSYVPAELGSLASLEYHRSLW